MSRDYAKFSEKRKHSYAKPSTAPTSAWKWGLFGLVIGMVVVSVFYLRLHYREIQEENKLVDQQTAQQAAALVGDPTKSVLAKATSHADDSATKVVVAQPKPTFDFYTVLPDSQQTADDDSNNAATVESTRTTRAIAPAKTDKALATTAASSPLATLPPPLTAPSTPSTTSLVATAAADLSAVASSITGVGTARTPPAAQHYDLQVAAFHDIEDAESLRAKLAMNGYVVKINADKQGPGRGWYRVVLGPFDTKFSAMRARQKLSDQNFDSIIVASR